MAAVVGLRPGDTRRQFRADPTYPAARAVGSSRLAVIRPASWPLSTDQLRDIVVVVIPQRRAPLRRDLITLDPLDHRLDGS